MRSSRKACAGGRDCFASSAVMYQLSHSSVHVGLDGVLEPFDSLHRRRVRWPRQDDIGVEIRLARLGRGESAAMRPDRDEVVAQDVAEPVTQAQPGRAGGLGDLI